ncbi:MAG: hypothetical protein QXX08_09285 [Candidatus Bathyarchaeia archaeon]
MGDLGVYASKFNLNSKSLKEFDEALRFLMENKKVTRTSEVTAIINKLLNVINPILESIKGNLSASITVNERSVVDIIRNRHNREWPTYRERIQELQLKLNSNEFTLSQTDFQLLNDIADALDAECANLFRRMSEGL